MSKQTLIQKFLIAPVSIFIFCMSISDTVYANEYEIDPNLLDQKLEQCFNSKSASCMPDLEKFFFSTGAHRKSRLLALSKALERWLKGGFHNKDDEVFRTAILVIENLSFDLFEVGQKEELLGFSGPIKLDLKKVLPAFSAYWASDTAVLFALTGNAKEARLAFERSIAYLNELQAEGVCPNISSSPREDNSALDYRATFLIVLDRLFSASSALRAQELITSISDNCISGKDQFQTQHARNQMLYSTAIEHISLGNTELARSIVLTGVKDPYEMTLSIEQAIKENTSFKKHTYERSSTQRPWVKNN